MLMYFYVWVHVYIYVHVYIWCAEKYPVKTGFQHYFVFSFKKNSTGYISISTGSLIS